MKKQFLIILLFLISFTAIAQEVITGLISNPKMLKHISNNSSKTEIYRSIPFVDDFSSENIYPADTLWKDKNVFINNDYCLFPPSVNVATFDALDKDGKLYAQAIATAFPADTLTSVKVRLDSVFGLSPGPLHVNDSVYFSFFYQPQGLGNAPEAEDSLLLEFYSATDTKWYKVWGASGTTMTNFHNTYGEYFKFITIPITDSLKYFSKDFQFRFRNYASLANNSIPSWAGNVDQWNIDYVYLGKNRIGTDSIFNDLVFVNKAPSFLKYYQAMPWNQYLNNPASEMKDSINNLISNMNDITKNSSYKFDVYDKTGTSVFPYPGGSYNIEPFIPYGYQTCPQHAHPQLGVFTFPSATGDSASFDIVHVVRDGLPGDYLPYNDTIRFKQKFYNYYAYDDGCPEAGYGLTPANSKLAYKFDLNIPDSLRAVDFFWNRTYNDASQKYFYLTVWSSLSPETIIYQKSGCKPQYVDSLNVFYRYYLDNPIPVSGSFYVGWKQTTADFLNVGFDFNTNSGNNIFYNTAGTWYQSMYSGSLMIRPVLGKPLPVGINENATINMSLHVYPNPTNGAFTISYGTLQPAIYIYNSLGKLIYVKEKTSQGSEQIDLSGYNKGIYFIKMQNGEKIWTNRIIIQ